jgi:hypothetical protein
MKAVYLTLLSSLLALPVFSAPLTVTKSGRQILVNGQPILIRGVNYSPAPIGSSIAGAGNGCAGPYRFWGDPSATYIVDFPLIKRMGANVVRTYETLNDTSPANASLIHAMLDKAHENGLYVIMGYYPDHTADMNDAAFRASVQAGFLAAVNTYKDHPAVLMWALGNEQNLDNGFGVGNSAWYGLVNTAAGLAKAADPNHLVMTVEGEVQAQDAPARPYQLGDAALTTTDGLIPNLDVWGINAYRGPSFGNLFSVLASSTNKPILITEYGKDAWRDAAAEEDQAMQATYLSSQWQEIASTASASSPTGVLAGGVIFEWADSWWKIGGFSCFVHDTTALFTRPTDTIDPNYTEEWFGIARTLPQTGTSRDFRTAYTTLQLAWNPTVAGTAGTSGVFNGTVHNYPNPFRAGAESTRFVANVNSAATVSIRIYDAGGQFVTSFSRSSDGAGRVEIIWDGYNRQGARVSPGLYIARIEGNGGGQDDTQFRKVVVVR